MGYALFLAQEGGQHPAAKRLKGDTKATRGVATPKHELDLIKAQLASQVARIIASRGLTQSAAAVIMGIDQPKVSRLLHGRLAGFSAERLLTWLTELGQDVDITVRTPAARRAGRLRVRMLAAG